MEKEKEGSREEERAWVRWWVVSAGAWVVSAWIVSKYVDSRCVGRERYKKYNGY